MSNIPHFSYKCPICKDNTWIFSHKSGDYEFYKRCPAFNFVEKGCNYRDYKENVKKAD